MTIWDKLSDAVERAATLALIALVTVPTLILLLVLGLEAFGF